jgi:hypothetical protein
MGGYMRGMGIIGGLRDMRATMEATMGGMGATMGRYMASMVAPIPSTNDGMGSFNVANTSNIFDKEGEKMAMKKKVMRRTTMSHECHL